MILAPLLSEIIVSLCSSTVILRRCVGSLPLLLEAVLAKGHGSRRLESGVERKAEMVEFVTVIAKLDDESPDLYAI